MFKNLIPEALKRAVRVRRERRRLARGYNEIALDEVEELMPLKGKSVLIVGANTGEDCGRFLKRGAAEVHGLDVVDNIGAAFAHPKVTYHRQSIEKADLPSASYDLVFAVATMEHVPNIAAGFAEMVRLTKAGGLIYSSATPLWQSPYGHHMGCFEGHPWVHLLFDVGGLVRYATDHGITGERGHAIEGIAAYMLDYSNFNMLPGSDYIAACSDLPGIEAMANRFDSEDDALMEHPLGKLALERGYERQNLLATRHLFIARKT